ncbi:uncharacterized protein LOC131940979 [Physella acuta]|uniref:uncharacterized protein LOC131940979 n=1 Tax=Physella acuta TaxID=109671 RepID=UPI0027DBA5E2|nr:uncharacterized protein LOC131940979 [Physella acuta]
MLKQRHVVRNCLHKCLLYRDTKMFSQVNASCNNFIRVSDEVREAIHARKPVVALESTIITHGMPYPHNFSTALSVERRVRENGAVPATVAVLNGKLCVGLCDTELILLAEKNSNLIKVSRRDLPYVLSQGLSGGTTVSGTMIAAHLAGIPIFATGGVGGVHRGAETSFDISADLTELGRTPVTVVSSGIKSILDIPKTLEYLETQGVCVVTFGKDKNFPAFFSPDSGCLSPYNVQTHLEAAQLINTQLKFGLTSGTLVAVPIPAEFAATGEIIQHAINEAHELARKNNVTGKEVTPYVLKTINELTEGESLVANIALVENNASVAAGIALCLSQLESGVPLEQIATPPQTTSCSLLSSPALKSALEDSANKLKKNLPSDSVPTCDKSKLCGRPIVIGSTVVDYSVQVNDPKFQLNGGTYPGKVSQSYGGVGRNLADCLSRLEYNPVFLSAVGNDSHSSAMSAFCGHMDLSSVQKVPEMSTASCYVLLSQGKFLLGIGDMDINFKFDIDHVKNFESLLESAPIVVLDGNFTPQVIHSVVTKCAKFSVPVWFEPTDLFKAKIPFETDAWKNLTFISPNLGELISMYQSFLAKTGQKEMEVNISEESSSLDEILEISVPMCRHLVKHIPVVLLTLGRHGVLLCHSLGNIQQLLPLPLDNRSRNTFSATYYPGFSKDMEPSRIVSVSGAGDCLAATVVAGMLAGDPADVCIKNGLWAAYLSLLSASAVPDTITRASIKTQTDLPYVPLDKSSLC